MSDSTLNPDLSLSNETQQRNVEESPTRNPDEFRTMAQDINLISAEEHSSKAEDTSAELLTEEQPENQTGAVEILLAPLVELLGNLVKVWKENRTLLISLGLVLVVLPLATLLIGLVVSLLTAIHSVPLLASILRLIGVGYSVWFVSRYLLSESMQQKLSGLWQKLLQAAASQ